MSKNNFFEVCKNLSTVGNASALNSLISYYLNANDKNTRMTARKALEKTPNKEGLLKILNNNIEKESDFENKSMLLYLGFRINRCKFLYSYLSFHVLHESDLKDVFIKHIIGNRTITPNPLSLNEKSILLNFIVENHVYDKILVDMLDHEQMTVMLNSLLSYAKNHGFSLNILKLFFIHEDYLEHIQDFVVDFIDKQGVTLDMLNILSKSNNYLERIQNTITIAFLNNVDDSYLYARYLDLTNEDNQKLILTINDLSKFYNSIKENKFLLKITNISYLNISLVLKVLRKEALSPTENRKIMEYICTKIELIDSPENEIIFFDFINDFFYYENEFVKEQLIVLHKKTRLYSDFVLNKLLFLHSNYAYREMINFMLTSEDRKTRYKYAVKLIMHFPEKYDSVIDYAKELDDKKLLVTMSEVKSRFNEKKTHQLPIMPIAPSNSTNNMKWKILDNDIIVSELLYEICLNIQATSLLVAVGFVFDSGLKLLQPLITSINVNNGIVELIIGSLQNYGHNMINQKMDKKTAITLNELINTNIAQIYTYNESFYHGKFYYIAGINKSYVLLGSSNISKTAYLNNKELDILFEFTKDSIEELSFLT